jgi:hypothetical protein
MAKDKSSSRLSWALVVTIYCLVALLVCLMLGFSWTKQRSALAAIHRDKSAALSDVLKRSDQAEAAYRVLEAEQATNRGAYTGEEAVAMSLRVQRAQSEVDVLNDEKGQAKAAVDAAKQQMQVLSLRFVPLIAVGLAHILALVLIVLANPRQRELRR